MNYDTIRLILINLPRDELWKLFVLNNALAQTSTSELWCNFIIVRHFTNVPRLYPTAVLVYKTLMSSTTSQSLVWMTTFKHNFSGNPPTLAREISYSTCNSLNKLHSKGLDKLFAVGGDTLTLVFNQLEEFNLFGKMNLEYKATSSEGCWSFLSDKPYTNVITMYFPNAKLYRASTVALFEFDYSLHINPNDYEAYQRLLSFIKDNYFALAEAYYIA